MAGRKEDSVGSRGSRSTPDGRAGAALGSHRTEGRHHRGDAVDEAPVATEVAAHHEESTPCTGGPGSGALKGASSRWQVPARVDGREASTRQTRRGSAMATCSQR
ncbi:putative serine/arginine repetitive matrix protein 1-like [Iris pallida]|uniref:Serine/arginine repetitive matrix protein 1-like n=1 Tax=Iris pallida TaxID=29817 RepID=A0AAX6EB49_IRIPA|nr:putative serine/arginine repetitive matrix protein 1-like [Iris pallida]